MTFIRGLFAVLVCSLLVGCASTGAQTARSGSSQSDPCVGDASATCKITVTVRGCAPDQITADPVKTYVGRGSSPIMQFELSPESRMLGYRFATQQSTGKDGIVFKTTAGQSVFTRRGSSPIEITFTNAHSSSAVVEYEYGINVIQLGSSGPGAAVVCPQKDPWIVNL